MTTFRSVSPSDILDENLTLSMPRSSQTPLLECKFVQRENAAHKEKFGDAKDADACRWDCQTNSSSKLSLAMSADSTKKTTCAVTLDFFPEPVPIRADQPRMSEKKPAITRAGPTCERVVSN